MQSIGVKRPRQDSDGSSAGHLQEAPKPLCLNALAHHLSIPKPQLRIMSDLPSPRSTSSGFIMPSPRSSLRVSPCSRLTPSPRAISNSPLPMIRRESPSPRASPSPRSKESSRFRHESRSPRPRRESSSPRFTPEMSRLRPRRESPASRIAESSTKLESEEIPLAKRQRMVKHDTAPFVIGSMVNLDGQIGLVLSVCEHGRASIYYPMTKRYEMAPGDAVPQSVDSEPESLSYIGPFQATIRLGNHSKGSFVCCRHSTCHPSADVVLGCAGIRQMTPACSLFFRKACFDNGLAPIVRHIVSTDHSIGEYEILFDLVMTHRQCNVPAAVMQLLQPTYNTQEAVQAILNAKSFSEIHDKHEWDTTRLVQSSEDPAEVGKERNPCPIVPMFLKPNERLWENQVNRAEWMRQMEEQPFSSSRFFWFPVPRHGCSGSIVCHSPFFGRLITEESIPDVRGGILADGPGLGKTVTTLTLMHIHRVPTLVVASMAVLQQWRRELSTRFRSECRLTSALWNETYNEDTTDVVWITPGALTSSSDSCRRILQRHWGRLVVDDAHEMTFKRKLAEAVTKITTTCCWLVTHSPIVTSAMDLRVLMEPLRIPGFDASFWTKVDQRLSPKRTGPIATPASEFIALWVAMANLTRRQTGPGWKRAPPDALARVTLQPLPIVMGDQEREVYQRTLAEAQACQSCMRCRSAVPSILKRLRKLCSYDMPEHAAEGCRCVDKGLGSVRKLSSEEKASPAAETAITDPSDGCAICKGPLNMPRQTPCRHVFCRSCLAQWMSRKMECPVCRGPILSKTMVRPRFGDGVVVPPEEHKPLATYSKLQHIAQSLAESKKAKVMVCSQFASSLLELKRLCEEKHVPVVLVDSTTRPPMRRKRMGLFDAGRSANILLIHTNIAASSRTLPAVQRLVFFEPCAQSEVERKILDRVATMGRAPVLVQFPFLAHTIEQHWLERIWATYDARDVPDTDSWLLEPDSKPDELAPIPLMI